MSRLFRFPNPVNETAARAVAAGVVVQAVLFLVTRSGLVLIPLTYGFLARVLTGPTLSPLGQFATRYATRLRTEHRFVPGPPKRFAQAVGLAFTAGASLAWISGAHAVAILLIAGLLIAASLESVWAVCLGCIAFNRMMRWGWIPTAVCADCNDVSGRLNAALLNR